MHDSATHDDATHKYINVWPKKERNSVIVWCKCDASKVRAEAINHKYTAMPSIVKQWPSRGQQ
eukprot:11286724-Alexandrium_andersonii.AAC.1